LTIFSSKQAGKGITSNPNVFNASLEARTQLATLIRITPQNRTVFGTHWHGTESHRIRVAPHLFKQRLACTTRPAPAALALGGIRKVLARARELADGAAPDQLGQ
jgi:hypothetical protein